MPRKKKDVKLFTLDTETYGLFGAIKRIAIYDGDQIHYGYTFEDVEPVLIEASKDYKVHCYIHNMNFDVRKTPSVFRKGNVKWNQTLAINRRYTTIVCQHYVLHDSWQIIDSSLKQASKDFDLTHGKMDLWEEVQKTYPNQYKDEEDYFMRCDKDDPLYVKYLGYDVISLYELIMKLIEVSTVPLENFVKCPTTASLSRYIFKNGYNGKQFGDPNDNKTDFDYFTKNKYWLSEKPLINNPDISYQEIEYKQRNAYCGGRTEVFTPLLEGSEKINGYYYDVNSLYPYACLNEFPIGVPEYISEDFLINYKWKLWLKNKRGLGFLKCKVFIPKQKIPPLPSRLEKLSFFTGYIEGTWTFHELEYAIKNCGVIIEEVSEMIFYKETYPVYRNFIMTFAKIKEKADKEGNMAYRSLSKLLMNTAYGYACMSRDDKTEFDYIENAEKYIKEGRLISMNKEEGFCEVKSIVRSETIQVQIGAYVTSYARLILLDALRQQSEIGEVYYCDTDSIVCEKPMDPAKVDNRKLGFWGLENVLKSGVFLQPKVYALERSDESFKFKFKGVSKDRQKEFDYKFYKGIYNSLANKENGKLMIDDNIERFHGLVTAHKNGLDPNEKVHGEKTMNLNAMQKRKIDYAENTSEAWHMNSYEDFYNFKYVDIDYRKDDLFVKRRKK